VQCAFTSIRQDIHRQLRRYEGSMLADQHKFQEQFRWSLFYYRV